MPKIESFRPGGRFAMLRKMGRSPCPHRDDLLISLILKHRSGEEMGTRQLDDRALKRGIFTRTLCRSLNKDAQRRIRLVSFKFRNIARISALREPRHSWIELQRPQGIGRGCHLQWPSLRRISETAAAKLRTAPGAADPVRTDDVRAGNERRHGAGDFPRL